VRGYGDAHHAAPFKIERGNDRLAIVAIKLGNGVTGCGVETKWVHGRFSVLVMVMVSIRIRHWRCRIPAAVSHGVA
jgi:hypothetical protein